MGRDPGALPPAEGPRNIERLEAELAMFRELAARRAEGLREDARFFLEILDALGWESGSVEAIVAGVKEWRKALKGAAHGLCRHMEGECLIKSASPREQRSCDAARKALRPKET